MKNFTFSLMIITSILFRCFSLSAQEAKTYSDDFSVAHDYLTDTIGSTIWDGLKINNGFLDVTTEAVVNALNTNDTKGALSFSTTSSYWSGENDNGAFLYKNISGDLDFDVYVKVVGGDFSSNGATAVAYLMAGPMVRRADTISFLAMQVFDQYSVGYGLRSLPASLSSTGNEENWKKDDGNGTELTTTAFPFLKLSRTGSTYTAYCSADSVTWIAYLTQTRPDMSGHELQVGLYNATYTENAGLAIFDNFKLVEKVRTSAPVFNSNNFKAFYTNNSIIINSASSISNVKLYSANGSVKASLKNINSSSCSIPVKDKGVYIVVLENEGNRYSQKIVAY